VKLGRYHPAIKKFRLMKEFGWTTDQLAELNSKLGEEILFIISTIDDIVEDRMNQAERQRSR
jgi:hypothetical protein